MSSIAKWLWFVAFSLMAFGMWAFVLIPLAIALGVFVKLYWDDLWPRD